MVNDCVNKLKGLNMPTIKFEIINGIVTNVTELTGEETVVDGIHTLTDEVDYKIYNDRGLRISQLQRGLNILKYSNGRIRKVIVK